MEIQAKRHLCFAKLLATAAVLAVATAASAAEGPVGKTSYAPVAGTEAFATVKQVMEKEKPAVMKRQADLLAERYDLGNKAAPGVTMKRGKLVQEGVRGRRGAVSLQSWAAARGP